MIKQDIFKNLNKDQHKAALAELGNNLILAGAGTGKTSTIVGRVTYLLTELNVKPKEIILFTFTSLAAVEMKERLSKYIDNDIVGEISISTFHSLCLRLIKKYYPKKKLITEQEAKNLLSITYSRVIKFVPDGLYASNTLYSYIDNYINCDTESIFNEWLESKLNLDDNENKNFLLEQYQFIYDSYAADKQKYNILTFVDLLVLAREHLLKNTYTIKEMIVDEFQDTNPLQDSTIKAIASDSLFCVGDYDQSIYAFNGADLTIIENFKNRDKFKLYNLSKNYRCKEPILKIAEKVIANNKRIYPKSLKVMIEDDNAKEPYVFVGEDALEQYMQISDKCLEILNKKKDDETVAILYRSNGSGDGIEMILREKEIAIERNVKNTFMENIDVQIIFRILELIVHRKVDYMGFMNLFTGIVHYSSKEAIESYYNMITLNGSKNTLDGLRQDKARQIGSNGVFYADAKESVLSLLEILEFTKYINISTIIGTIINSNYFCNTINRWTSSISKEDEERAAKLYSGAMSRAESLLKISKRYNDTQRFYRDMTRPLKNKKDDNQNNSEIDDEPNKVLLMTVHSSKGLEFNYVFIIDLDDLTFPSKRLMIKEDDSEERRLFYVGCTRAKDELVFSYARKNKQGKIKKPSRFLVEAELLK